MLFGDIDFFLNVLAQIEQGESRRWGVCQLVGDDDVAFALGVVPLQFPVAGAVAVVSAPTIVLLHEVIAPLGSFFAKQRTEDVEAVRAGVVGEFCAG